MRFGENLRIIRKRKRLNQTELGQKIGMGRSSIGNWESGEFLPRIDKVFNIVKALDINPFELIGDYSIGDIEILKKSMGRELSYEDILAVEFSKALDYKAYLDNTKNSETMQKSMMEVFNEICKKGKVINGILSDEEKSLLLSYQCLNEHGKKTLFDYLSNMLRFPQYINVVKN